MRRTTKVNPFRLLDLLKPDGFSLGLKTRAADAFTVVRPSPFKDLWESIIVDAQGRRGEAVYASVGASATATVMYKILGDVMVLEELGEDRERGWTVIEDDSKAIAWEAQLAEVGPARAREWALKTGPKILQDTDTAREAVSQYLLLLGSVRNLDATLASLHGAVSAAIVDDVHRLSECPGATGVPGTEVAYQVAYYTILHYSRKVESGRSFVGHNPGDDLELMQRIHILADKLLLFRKPGEKKRGRG